MSATYSATVKHASLEFTRQGRTDHEAVTQAMKVLKAIWDIDSHRAVLTVKLGDQIQYVTTAAQYEMAIH